MYADFHQHKLVLLQLYALLIEFDKVTFSNDIQIRTTLSIISRHLVDL